MCVQGVDSCRGDLARRDEDGGIPAVGPMQESSRHLKGHLLHITEADRRRLREGRGQTRASSNSCEIVARSQAEARLGPPAGAARGLPWDLPTKKEMHVACTDHAGNAPLPRPSALCSSAPPSGIC